MMQTEDTIPENCHSMLWKSPDGHWCSRFFPPLILAACLCTLIAIPFKIISYGFLPGDDALRHVGKALSNRSWDQILVSDAPIPDIHIGWHQFLFLLNKILGFDGDGLVVLSVVFLFLVVVIPPLFFHRRPESWIAGVLFTYLFLMPASRLFLGRPYLVHMAVLIVILLARNTLNDKKNHWVTISLLTLFLAVSIWWRMLWFLYILPIGVFVIARQWRAAVRLGIMLVIATLGAGIACGQPQLIIDTLLVVLKIMGSSDCPRQVVSELQPIPQDGTIILLPVFIFLSVKIRGGSVRHWFDSPVFYLVIASWFLGTFSSRWWLDFGIPAVLVMTSEEIDTVLSREARSLVPWFSVVRAGMALTACGLLFFNYTNDKGGRWSSYSNYECVDIADESIQDGLPGEEGIIYSVKMDDFFQTFFKYPNAKWRYVLGYEPVLMSREDLAVFRNIHDCDGAWEAFIPWLEKMRPQDRLWVPATAGAGPPPIPRLKWTRMTDDIWSGGLKDAGSDQPMEEKKGIEGAL